MRSLFYGVVTAVCLQSAMGEVVFNDDFSDGDVITPSKSASGAIWNLGAGKFSADGSDIGNYKPVSGELNFPLQVRASVQVDFGPVQKDSVVLAKLDLRQSNVSSASHRFDLVLSDKASGEAFVVAMSPNPEFFGPTGFAIFDGEGNLLVRGVEGTHLRQDDQWQKIEVSVEGRSIVLKQDDMVIAERAQGGDASTPDRLALISASGDLSWFVDNVEIEAVLDQDQLKESAKPWR